MLKVKTVNRHEAKVSLAIYKIFKTYKKSR